MPDLHTESETASRLGLSVHVLRDWRLRGTGPPYRDLDGSALYDLDEVVEWLDSRGTARGAQSQP